MLMSAPEYYRVDSVFAVESHNKWSASSVFVRFNTIFLKRQSFHDEKELMRTKTKTQTDPAGH